MNRLVALILLLTIGGLSGCVMNFDYTKYNIGNIDRLVRAALGIILIAMQPRKNCSSSSGSTRASTPLGC
ncbi:hypothetical protein [Rhabdochromatium marinum]|uniref:hypothetical protein n=1 Tax=Rhabdochromatium marinum TaxID=48729 RepID=UPI001F5B2644|nr:hypothetical protein [Rhabdochromatium marinum]MBK1649210.1 hypothetical protein [Rhabdochromatium marinum]